MLLAAPPLGGDAPRDLPASGRRAATGEERSLPNLRYVDRVTRGGDYHKRDRIDGRVNAVSA